MTKNQMLLQRINSDLKNSLSNEEKVRLNFLIYALHRINDGRVYQSENKLMMLVKEFTELNQKTNII